MAVAKHEYCLIRDIRLHVKQQLELSGLPKTGAETAAEFLGCGSKKRGVSGRHSLSTTRRRRLGENGNTFPRKPRKSSRGASRAKDGRTKSSANAKSCSHRAFRNGRFKPSWSKSFNRWVDRKPAPGRRPIPGSVAGCLDGKKRSRSFLPERILITSNRLPSKCSIANCVGRGCGVTSVEPWRPLADG